MKDERIEILLCRKNQRRSMDGWSFPKDVRDLIIRECDGLRVLHLFGGKADFGIRLDIDPLTKPDIIGDAWLPPFEKDFFQPRVGLPEKESYGSTLSG